MSETNGRGPSTRCAGERPGMRCMPNLPGKAWCWSHDPSPEAAAERTERARSAALARPRKGAVVGALALEWAATLKWQSLDDVKASLGELAELTARRGIDRRDGELIRKCAETWVRADQQSRLRPGEQEAPIVEITRYSDPEPA